MNHPFPPSIPLPVYPAACLRSSLFLFRETPPWTNYTYRQSSLVPRGWSTLFSVRLSPPTPTLSFSIALSLDPSFLVPLARPPSLYLSSSPLLPITTVRNDHVIIATPVEHVPVRIPSVVEEIHRFLAPLRPEWPRIILNPDQWSTRDGVRGELKVSWWVCYAVIRTLLMGFRFLFFFFPFFPPLVPFFHFCPLVVRFPATPAGDLLPRPAGTRVASLVIYFRSHDSPLSKWVVIYYPIEPLKWLCRAQVKAQWD